MPAYEYTTDVLTHGFMGRTSEELSREALEASLNRLGAEGWDLSKVVLDVALNGEKDGHVLIFKREV